MGVAALVCCSPRQQMGGLRRVFIHLAAVLGVWANQMWLSVNGEKQLGNPVVVCV